MSKLDSYVVSTSEVDDAQVAVNEILAQLPVDKLKAHSLGIVACHYEFALSTVLKEVCEALPFPVVGTITSAQASPQALGSFELVISVLTSDEAQFVSILSQPLTAEPLTAVEEAYQQAQTAGVADARPDLILIHAPFMQQNSGDDYLQKVSELSENAPLFGTLAIDDTEDFRYCFSLFNGEHYNDRMILTLIWGVEPRFYSANIAPNKIMGTPVLITESAGPFLIAVNDRPIAEYLADLGLAQLAEHGYAMSSMPFLLDYGDGTEPISRVFIALTPDGKVILNGSAPAGLQLTVGAFDKEDALQTTQIAVDDALMHAQDSPKHALMLAYSCIARSMALGADFLLELEQTQNQVANKIPFMMAYSGGEYCPTNVQNGASTNRFHNNALIICTI
ncbi:MAG: FIST C-terminal domain-containing protein [Coriobacteriales bacterium]|nr:FIST C-terminal domain-containing protein [Coriobacteriales bacterium]